MKRHKGSDTSMTLIEKMKEMEKTNSLTNINLLKSDKQKGKMTPEERTYLQAARQGDHRMLLQILDSPETRLNVNCVDYMGRNALHLAIDSDSIDTIEILMEKVNQECIEEALLHAINKDDVTVVRCMIDHPMYMAVEKVEKVTGTKDPFFRTDETYQFPPEISPLILAAHKDNYEMIQLFLSRGHTIARPHAIHCACGDCKRKQTCDSLKRSRLRLNSYKALASPAYMALSSSDPITTTFELRQELMDVARVETEFMNEYLALVDQCMNFAYELMDLCRSTKEIEAMLTKETDKTRDKLAGLKLAISYNEKKFVAHPNCQQHLTNIWYGEEMGFMQGASFNRKFFSISLLLLALPFICIAYIISPGSKLGSILRCPVTKFLTHTVSHIAFLAMLALASNHDVPDGVRFDANDLKDWFNITLLAEHRTLDRTLRPGLHPVDRMHTCIIIWVIGLLWNECKQIYYSGAKDHFRQFYNCMDFSILVLYVTSYSLRFVEYSLVCKANSFFDNAYEKATEALREYPVDMIYLKDLQSKLYNNSNYKHVYFMKGIRFHWKYDDPRIVSEVLFAVANVMSFARTTYVMPADSLLGPLQISLGRMFGDITRFIVLLIIVLAAFLIGLENLYAYYGSFVITDTKQSASEYFADKAHTMFTLFFSIFGLISLDKLRIDNPVETSKHMKSYLWQEDSSTLLVDLAGLLLFAVYQVVVSIVLVNMLIAMMSSSFEAIRTDNDVEWKFARTKLWMDYMEEGGTLPVPFNIVPTPKTIKYAAKSFVNLCKKEDKQVQYDFQRRRHNVIESQPISRGSLPTTFSDIVQRLVRRYLFKMERDRKDLDGGTYIRSEEGEFVEDEHIERSPSKRKSRESVHFITSEQGESSDVDQFKRSSKPEEDQSSHNKKDVPKEEADDDEEGIVIKRKPSRRLVRRHTKKPIASRIFSGPSEATIQRAQQLLEDRLRELGVTNVPKDGATQDVTFMTDPEENFTFIRRVMVRPKIATDQTQQDGASIREPKTETEVRILQQFGSANTRPMVQPKLALQEDYRSDDSGDV